MTLKESSVFNVFCLSDEEVEMLKFAPVVGDEDESEVDEDDEPDWAAEPSQDKEI